MEADDFQTGLERYKSSSIPLKDSSTPYQSKRVKRMNLVHPPHGSGDKNPLDDLDRKILKLLPNGHYCRSLAQVLKIHRATIQYRLKKMQKSGIIIPERHNIADNLSITYTIAPGWVGQSSKGGVIKPVQNAIFCAHATCWRFPIIRGGQPHSAFPQKLKHCKFYRFYEERATIVSTPKSLLIHVKVDLGADTIDNLNVKYLEVAQSVAKTYAKRFNLALGTPTKSGKTHYAIKGARISELVRDRGTFETSGFEIDDSHGEAHIETKDEQLAKGFEYTVTKMPQVVGDMSQQIENMHKIMGSSIAQQSVINNVLLMISNVQRQINEVREALKGSNPPGSNPGAKRGGSNN
ncbi:MAG: Lrp/AsnC family transcriptional regulator [Methanosarcinales archaeon]|nr:MAG: Lrp/AsnC family transcriptional regulator [Methanosarcinales archaeon]